ncbi:MAG: tRNA glutamyl-Q(34) synthetase GluQRS [Bacteroidales bacterium]|nr:tRNA glutamyl-Q(34) synthetase GluQRS [Bacteroidales bacterium]
MTPTGRFAPSPSGRMHLGNVYAALMSWLYARAQGGRWLIRIEDLDAMRCPRHFADEIIDDLRWLGLESDGEILYQSERADIYLEAFNKLSAQGLVYDCFCSRADLRASSAPHSSDGTPIYSGTCRLLTPEQKAELLKTRRPAQRVHLPDEISEFKDFTYGVQQCNLLKDCGDFVVRRADGVFAYQLAVTVDDALSGVTEVVRGCDLMPSAHLQIFLYKKLGYNVPAFRHLPLLTAPDGRRLSKRDDDTNMGYLRQHYTPNQVLGIIMNAAGKCLKGEELSLDDCLKLVIAECRNEDRSI